MIEELWGIGFANYLIMDVLGVVALLIGSSVFNSEHDTLDRPNQNIGEPTTPESVSISEPITLYPCSQMDQHQHEIIALDFNKNYSFIIPAQEVPSQNVRPRFSAENIFSETFDLDELIAPSLRVINNRPTPIRVSIPENYIPIEAYLLRIELGPIIEPYCVRAQIGDPGAIFVGNAGDGEMNPIRLPDSIPHSMNSEACGRMKTSYPTGGFIWFGIAVFLGLGFRRRSHS